MLRSVVAPVMLLPASRMRNPTKPILTNRTTRATEFAGVRRGSPPDARRIDVRGPTRKPAI